jgi:uncharacterized lipoprotein YmbA
VTPRFACAVAIVLMLAGCGSPPTKVFDLSAAADTPTAPLAAGPGVPLIWVDRPSVAGYFDRTQMVTRSGSNGISMHEFEVWSDPPADLIARAIVDDLARRFGKDRVMRSPVGHYATPDWRVELDVTRFDVDETGQAVLDARWTLLAGANDRLVASRRESITSDAGDVTNATRRVAALRETVAVLAGRIGDAITDNKSRR